MTRPDEEQRQRLAAGLRALRQGAGLSTTLLAKRLGWSQAKVSRTELGQTRPKPHDVKNWATATGADPARQLELVKLAEQAIVQFTEWRRDSAPGRRKVQQDIQRLEAAASRIRVFAPVIVVGLAQTRAYAESIFRRSDPPIPEPEIGEIVDARLARQEVLTDQSMRFHLLMGEAALRRRLVAQSDMRVQLERLTELSSLRNVTIGVIPFDADERVHQYHGFEIIGDPEVDEESMVSAVNLTRTINIRSAEDVDVYVSHFEALRLAAVEGQRLREFLQGVIADLTGD